MDFVIIGSVYIKLLVGGVQGKVGGAKGQKKEAR